MKENVAPTQSSTAAALHLESAENPIKGSPTRKSFIPVPSKSPEVCKQFTVILI
jgi:hypothetical protein